MLLSQSRKLSHHTVASALLGLPLAAALATGCGKDALDAIPQTPPAPVLCSDGSEAVEGVCPTPVIVPGTLTGAVCNRETGIWLQGVSVSLQAGGATFSTQTDVEGNFTIEGLPPGSYYVHFTGDVEYDLPAVITAGQTTRIGDTECIAPPGHLKGRVCDESRGLWLSDATITLNDPAATSVETDIYGNFIFLSIPAGDYVLSITAPGGYSATRQATVVSGEVTELGPSQCVGGEGSVNGRVCGGDGFWLSGARVYIDMPGGGTVETTTDAQGYFVLNGVPAGVYTLTVIKGSFEATFPVTVISGGPTILAAPVCVPPHSTRMAVVTGVYDSVETVLSGLGFAERNRYTTSTTPQVVDPNGSVDIINGETSAFWTNSFLADPLWMAEYDIIFFNCGVDDSAIETGAASAGVAVNNLRAFVEAGGSVYASDWASEIIRLAFTGRINWQNGNSSFGAARVGVEDPALPANIPDAALSAALSRSSVTINLNLPVWVVMSNTQPAGVRTLVRGNVKYYSDPFGLFSSTLNNAPLVVRFDYSAGRVLYTSAHNESQTTQDLRDILNYIIFEL